MKTIARQILRLAPLLLAAHTNTSAFLSPTTTTTATFGKNQQRHQQQLFLFGRGDKSENAKDGTNESKAAGLTGLIPWFGRREENDNETVEESEQNDNSDKGAAVTSGSETSVKTATDLDSPEALAARLRAEAERARLEAERMDAELTLQKIARLEKELKHQQSVVGKAIDDEAKMKRGQERIQDLQREMQTLQSKMLGEAPPAVAPKARESDDSTNGDVAGSAAVASTSSQPVVVPPGGRYRADLSRLIVPFSAKKFNETRKYLNDAPGILLKTLALQFEYDFDNGQDINATEVAIRFDQANRLDFSYSKRPVPYFTKQQIDEKAAELAENKFVRELTHERILEAAQDNMTQLALYTLEFEYYNEDVELFSVDQLDKIAQDEEWLQPVITALNKSAVDNAIESLFPKCMRKEDAVPTMAQTQQLIATVLPKAGFAARAKPEPVEGGYIIRGSIKKKDIDGNTLIEAIEKELEKTSLGEKMTVLYLPDFTIFADEEFTENPMFDPSEQDPILFVTGPDICREPRPLALSAVSAAGLATSWYLSIYPFLLNPAIAKRVDEDLALVDSGMTPDLSWLTELSVPLFLTFVGIQLAHELGHSAVAAAKKIKTSVPTFVPSVITGVTSTVTTFKTPPKNKQEMFDFSIAGPLVGMLASVAAIAVGSQLTVVSDPSYLPALPLEILRQSTLGGGIINGILGNGALSVPEGALGSQAVAGMTIPLHPVAIAGYISLVVNSLSLLPVGTTDGGRIALALFGRGAKLLVGNIFLFALFLVGLVGSDLFLFYFTFLIVFQAGNEIPARNEVDNIEFSRIGLAAVSYVVAMLALIPFQ